MVDPSIAQVHIDVVDINDNPPHFEKDTFYAGKHFFIPPQVLKLTVAFNFKVWTTVQTATNSCCRFGLPIRMKASMALSLTSFVLQIFTTWGRTYHLVRSFRPLST